MTDFPVKKCHLGKDGEHIDRELLKYEVIVFWFGRSQLIVLFEINIIW